MSRGEPDFGVPQVRYVDAGGLSVAYQVFGEGPDLVMLQGLVAHLEGVWEIPGFARGCRDLARAFRVVCFDKRGTGMSDRLAPGGEVRLDERMQDVCAVMDAVGIERAVLLAGADGVPVGCLFAATFPERVTQLVLTSGSARMLADEGYECGLPEDAAEFLLDEVERRWGSATEPAGLEIMLPSRANDPGWGQTLARLERLTCSPSMARAQVDATMRLDIREVLPAIQAPTLVVHSREDLLMPVAQGRWLAEHIAGARFVELRDTDHLAAFEPTVTELLEFVTGARPAEPADTALVTVLFTDIVSSTRIDASVGDQEWRLILDRHDAMTRRQLGRYRGREVKSTGDGFLATFTGPAAAIECACAIRDGASGLGIEIRAGLHTGIVEVRGEDITGAAVNTAARVVDRAGPSEVLVSRTVADLLAGSTLRFEDRGTHELKGLPDAWQLYAVA